MSGDDRPGSGERTIIRPTPGGRRGAAGPDATGAGGAAPPSQPPPRAAPPAPHSAPGPAAGPAPELSSIRGAGVNALVDAAMPLLLLAAGLRGAREHPDVATLHAEVTRQVTEFQNRAQAAGAAPEAIAAARYGLCTFIDEVVMNTPWGSRSMWAGRPLLLMFHKDTGGGEKFFQMVERVLADREPRRDLIEFFYVCLALGFEGRYRVAEGGASALAATRERLYSRIREWRPDAAGELSGQWQGVQDRRYRLVRLVPAWVFGAGAAAVLAGAFVIFQSLLASATSPALAGLNQVQQATFESPVSTGVAAGPALAELLEGAHPQRLSVEVEGEETRLTLLGQVFASGRTEMGADYRAVLATIAEALERVPGRVLVVGHTDDVPIRSARFKDNYDLSRQRAENVAERLKALLEDPGRVSYIGVGADQPRYTPVNTRENRARNRRVEIVVRRPGGAA